MAVSKCTLYISQMGEGNVLLTNGIPKVPASFLCQQSSKFFLHQEDSSPAEKEHSLHCYNLSLRHLRSFNCSDAKYRVANSVHLTFSYTPCLILNHPIWLEIYTISPLEQAKALRGFCHSFQTYIGYLKGFSLAPLSVSHCNSKHQGHVILTKLWLSQDMPLHEFFSIHNNIKKNKQSSLLR